VKVLHQSRHGRDLDNWALFEPFRLTDATDSELTATDLDFHKAMKRLDLQFDSNLLTVEIIASMQRENEARIARLTELFGGLLGIVKHEIRLNNLDFPPS
jgi:hypothetical protein